MREREWTKKRDRRLGVADNFRTPPKSTILVARSKFLPKRKCNLDGGREEMMAQFLQYHHVGETGRRGEEGCASHGKVIVGRWWSWKLEGVRSEEPEIHRGKRRRRKTWAGGFDLLPDSLCDSNAGAGRCHSFLYLGRRCRLGTAAGSALLGRESRRRLTDEVLIRAFLIPHNFFFYKLFS